MDSRENTEETSTESSHDSIAKKATLLYVFKVLKERTNDDRDEYLNYKQISEILKNEYHVKQGRKAVSDNIDLIKDFFDRNPEFKYKIVIREPAGTGVALASDRKELEDSERIFLIDAVYASRAINAQTAQDIMEYLVDGQSDYLRKRYLNRNTEDLTRTDNWDFLLNVEKITDAIKRNKQIKFKYCDYDENGILQPRQDAIKEGDHLYYNTPRFFISANDTYYVLCDYKTHGPLSYKVNHMKDVVILEDKDGIKPEQSKYLGTDFNIEQWQNEHFFMFNGASIDAKLKIRQGDSNARTHIFERFGQNVSFTNDDNGGCIVGVRADTQSLFYWTMQYLDEVEVIEPQSLRDSIAKTCRAAAEKHSLPLDPEPAEENSAE